MPDVFVARQPIFDLDDRLLGYELLYRSSGGANGGRGALRGPRPADTAVHAMIGIGVNRFANGRVAFVDFTREFLLDSLHDLFEPGTLVVEVREAARCDEEALAACERLVRDGHRLALDDFAFTPGCEPLLRLAEIVKIDVRDRSAEELADLAEQLRPFDVRLLAQSVDSGAVRDECARAGFELFQGYFFARPELLARRALGDAQAATVRVMNLLRDSAATDAEVEQAFRADPSLAHQLLGLANAAAPRGSGADGSGDAGVDSVLVAQHLVGRETVAHWLALLLVLSLASAGPKDAELVRMSMVRGRMCELIADERREASAAFLLVGLFSNLDALLQAPMEEVLTRLRVPPAVREALLERRGPCADALELAELYERGAWREMAAAAAHLGIPTPRVAQMYTDALGWTRERLARWERARG